MTHVTVDGSLLAALLDARDPALRAMVLSELLDRAPDDPDLVAARAAVPEQPWVKATLAAHHGDGTWGRGFYDKYRGTSWVLLHLSEFGVPMDLPPVRLGVRHLLETARPIETVRGMHAAPFAGLRDACYWHYPIVCLTAHMALVLIRSGLAEHPVTRGALALCRHRFQAAEGFGCSAVIDSLLPACVMTVPKVLKALLAIPPARRTHEDDDLIRAMADVLLRFDLTAYLPEATREWRTLAPTLTPARRRAAKAEWIAAGRLEPRRSKEGWSRVGFPLGYNSDGLEVLLLLGEAGTARDATIERGLETLARSRCPDGTWLNSGPLASKMHADIGRPGTPSPWVTFRALLAFKRFGALHLPGSW